MFQNWFKENKLLIIVTGAIILCLVIGWILYALFGYQLIETVCEGRPIGLLNSIFKSQFNSPVEYYFKKADRLFYDVFQNILLLSLPLVFILSLKLIFQRPSIIIQSIQTGFLIGILSIFLSNYGEWRSYNRGYTISFMDLSLSPFEGGNIQQYRMLIPLIGWITGLKGKYFFVLSTLGTLSFLAAANYWARTFYKDKKTAILITLLVSFLPVVQFNNMFYWIDIFRYLFLVIALLNPKYCSIIILFGILTHEFFFLYIPFIYLYHYCFNRNNMFPNINNTIKQIFYLGASLFIYSTIRVGISSFLDPVYNFEFLKAGIEKYGFTYPLIQPLLLGFFAAYEMSWLLIFPFIVYLSKYWRKMCIDVFLLAAAFIPPASFLFVAHDTTRIWSNSFFIIFLLPKYISDRMRNYWLICIVILNFLIPTFYYGYNWEAPLDKHAKIVKKIYLKNKDIRALTKSPRWYRSPQSSK